MEGEQDSSFDARVRNVLQAKLVDIEKSMSLVNAEISSLDSSIDSEKLKLNELEPARSRQLVKREVTKESIKVVAENTQVAENELEQLIIAKQVSFQERDACKAEYRHVRGGLHRIKHSTHQTRAAIENMKKDIKREILARQKLEESIVSLEDKKIELSAHLNSLKTEFDSQCTLFKKLQTEIELLIDAELKQDDSDRSRFELLVQSRKLKTDADLHCRELLKSFHAFLEKVNLEAHSLQGMKSALRRECFIYKGE